MRGGWEQRLADVSDADLLILDPPYGRTKCEWDDAPDLAALAAAVERMSRPAATVCVFAMQPFATDVVAAWRRWFRYDLIWAKRRTCGFLNANRQPLRNHELLLVFSRHKSATKYRPQCTPCRPYVSRQGTGSPIYGRHARRDTRRTEHNPRSILTFDERQTGKIHPTQKPLALIEWLVKTYTDPGDLVVDPYSGSGVTAAACLSLVRRFLGSERDRTYFARAKRRLTALAGELAGK